MFSKAGNFRQKHLEEPNMNYRSTLFALAIGFGILIALIAALALGAIRKAASMYQEMQVAQDSYLRAESFRRGIATDTYLADILLRDYLLDPTAENAPRHRQELLSARESLQNRMAELSDYIRDNDNPTLNRLKSEVEAYWVSLDPVFEWSAGEKAERSWVFLARNVLPRREAVVNLAKELLTVNNENLEKERRRLQASQAELRTFLLQMMGIALGLGTLVALLTMHRVGILEKRHATQRQEIEESQNNLRRLSQRLVQAQEGEKKILSRELHDEVGQMLTALGIELGNLGTLHDSDGAGFHARLEDAKSLNADTMRAIRDLAMGLRPSMLDDLGLEAALEWQGREFSRRTGVPANVEVNGALDYLSDAQRTCIYRVVQEALTNCARHANASNVRVSVSTRKDGVVALIRDDGDGFQPESPSARGLGLIGIQERVQALDGNVDISSKPKSGTTIRVQIPVGASA
jgi:signal transduction histidine kinase